jgi:hypothetical protein
MTKATEIAFLKQTAEKLGPNSYCGPWLSNVLPDLIATINNDLTPEPKLLAESYREAAAIVADAKAEAERMLAHARKSAEALVTAGEKRSMELRQWAVRGALKGIMDEVAH